MKTKTINFLRAAFPFAVTLFLWRGALPWINPGGLLCLVPIFFYTFIRPVPWFAPFAFLMCFLLDYRGDTILYWTAVWCLMYAANGFQTFIDLKQSELMGAKVFCIFFGLSVLILSLPHMVSFWVIVRVIWTVLWVCALYLPMVKLMERVNHD